MRFIYQLTDVKLPSRIKLDGDNLITVNKPAEPTNAYFSSGDLVINYDKLTGRILTFDAYLPRSLKRADKLEWPQARPGLVLVGDLTETAPFIIDELLLEISKDEKYIHAGKGKSETIVQVAEGVCIGLKNEKIEDIYFKLEI